VRSDWECFLAVAYQRILMSIRNPGDLWQSFAFFTLVMLLFPLSLGSDQILLNKVAPSIMWVSILLALLFSLTDSFAEDYRDGTLEIWLSASYPLAWIVFAKVIADWLLAMLPLLLCLPLLLLFFQLPISLFKILVETLVLGTVTLYGIGSIFSALVVGFRQSSWLLALLLLPAAIPVLIFSCSAIQSASYPVTQVAVLGIFALLSLLICPIVTAFALRVGVQGQ
jgi:heme exporter protein B